MQSIRGFFHNNPLPEMAAVYLFGSRGSGVPRTRSDVDIGIVLKPEKHLSTSEIIKLSMEIDDVLSPLETDVKILNDLPVHVTHNILRRAKLIYCVDEIADADFREHLVAEYFEMKPLLEEFYKAL
jgi:predicted nucleotidyltransferase